MNQSTREKELVVNINYELFVLALVMLLLASPAQAQQPRTSPPYDPAQVTAPTTPKGVYSSSVMP